MALSSYLCMCVLCVCSVVSLSQRSLPVLPLRMLSQAVEPTSPSWSSGNLLRKAIRMASSGVTPSGKMLIHPVHRHVLLDFQTTFLIEEYKCIDFFKEDKID